MLRLSMAVGDILESNGYDVIFTRTTDVTQSVGQKAAIANEEGADLFISLHRNAAEYPGQYTGVETLITKLNIGIERIWAAFASARSFLIFFPFIKEIREKKSDFEMVK